MLITTNQYIKIKEQLIAKTNELCAEQEDHMITKQSLDYVTKDYEKVKEEIEALRELNESNITWKNYWKNRYDKVSNTKEDDRAAKVTYLKRIIMKQLSNKTLKQIWAETWINPNIISRIKLGRYIPGKVACENYISKFEVSPGFKQPYNQVKHD